MLRVILRVWGLRCLTGIADNAVERLGIEIGRVERISRQDPMAQDHARES